MTTETKLLPCPFCGEEPVFTESGATFGCNNNYCHPLPTLKVSLYPTNKHLFSAWNYRPKYDSLKASHEELLVACELVFKDAGLPVETYLAVQSAIANATKLREG